MKNDKVLFRFRSQDMNFIYKHSVADPPEEIPRETHNDLYEIIINLTGDVMFFVEGLTYQIAKGDIMFINNREIHRVKVLSSSKYERILFHFNPSYISSLDPEGAKSLLEFMDDPNKKNGHRLDGVKAQNSNIPKILKRIESFIGSDLPERELMIRVLMVEFLLELKTLTTRIGGKQDSNVRQDKKIRDITEYINNNLEQKMTLDFIADKFFINKYHLCHLFKRETGFTVFEYISSKRIMKSKELILEGNTLFDSCFNAGFSDYANFYKVFKKYTGISPKQFLKNSPPVNFF